MAHNSARSLRSLRWLLAALAVGAGGTLLASHHILVGSLALVALIPSERFSYSIAACRHPHLANGSAALPVGRPRYVWALLTSAAGVVFSTG